MKPKVKITIEEALIMNAIALELGLTVNETEIVSTFDRIYNKVSTFLFGAKSFKWGELKGL